MIRRKITVKLTGNITLKCSEHNTFSCEMRHFQLNAQQFDVSQLMGPFIFLKVLF